MIRAHLSFSFLFSDRKLTVAVTSFSALQLQDKVGLTPALACSIVTWATNLQVLHWTFKTVVIFLSLGLWTTRKTRLNN